jgi:CRP-like cAMP-binding protein
LDGPLSFFESYEFARLAERGEVHDYADGGLILEEGDSRRIISIILEGSCRVERASLGRGVVIATMGPRVIGGCRSSGVARRSVRAQGPAKVLSITPPAIEELLDSVPGLSTRFYQSLAVHLSRRLRDRTSTLPPLLVEDVAAVRPFASEHTGHGDVVDLPQSLVEDVETFKRTMLGIDRACRTGKSDDAEIAARVATACNEVVLTLHSHVGSGHGAPPVIGAYVHRETFPYLMAARFNDRAYTKPRGYAGDYWTIELLYRNEPAGDGRLGPHVDRWVMNAPSSQAVRNRREMIRAIVQGLMGARNDSGPLRICSLASGPAREIFDLFETGEPAELHATCLDIDNQAIAFAHQLAESRGIADHFTLAIENVIRLAQGRGRVTVPPQHLIYTMGLIDYLDDGIVVSLLDWGYQTLVPGGRIALGNFAAGNVGKEYLDHVLEWVLIHRSPEHLRELFARSRFGSSAVEIRRDETGVQLLAVAHKP